MTYARLNRLGPAMTWLEETVATGFPCYPSFETSHGFDPLRNEPRFIEFMKAQKQNWDRYKKL